MPEGDTILSAARRMGTALVGQPIESIDAPQRRHALDRWPERLAGWWGRAGLPYRRCGTPVRSRGQGDDNRTGYWCPGCQR
jgi:endonuclease-8